MNPESSLATAAPKSPFRSKTVLAAIVIAIVALLRFFGIEVSEDDAELSTAVDLLFTLGGVLVVIYGRMTAEKRVSFRTVPPDLSGPLVLVLVLVLGSTGCGTVRALELGASDEAKTVKLTFTGR